MNSFTLRTWLIPHFFLLSIFLITAGWVHVDVNATTKSGNPTSQRTEDLRSSSNATPTVPTPTPSADPSEIILSKANDFAQSVTLKGFEDVSDGATAVTGCGEACTTDKSTAPVIKFSLNKDKFHNTESVTKTVIVTQTKDELVRTAVVIVKIPGRVRIIDSKIKLGDNLDVKSLVEGQEATLDVSYILDDGQKTNAISLDSSNKEVLQSGDGKVLAKQSGEARAIVKVNQSSVIPIAQFALKVLAAVKSIEAPAGETFYLTEGGYRELKLAVKGTRGQAIGLDRIECGPGANSSSHLQITKNAAGFDVKALPLEDPTQLTENRSIVCKLNTPKTPLDTADDRTLTIVVGKKVGSIEIDALNGYTLLPDGNLTFVANIYDDKTADASANVVFRHESPSVDKQWISLSQQGKKLIVSWVDYAQPDSPNSKKLNRRPEYVNVEVEARLTDKDGKALSPILTQFTIHMAQVARFSSLKVKLNLMDEQTAGDLYGSVLRDEYHVLMIRLFNDLKNREGDRPSGDSILAYSSSIEVAVGLEKQLDKNINSGSIATFDKKQMREISKAQSQKVYNDFRRNLSTLDAMYQTMLDEFNLLMQEAFRKEQRAVQIEVEAESDSARADEARFARAESDAAYKVAGVLGEKLRNLYRLNVLATPTVSPPNVPISDGNWYPAGRDDLMQATFGDADLIGPDQDDEGDDSMSRSDGEPNCIDTITYRPLTFEMVVNTVDRRQERSLRSRAFKLLESVALGTSFVTAVAVPANSSDLPLGLEKYTNLLIPGLEKLFPNMKEQYRQNIVSQTMKTIEEIPFGSDITRVIFIPKRPIRGLIPGQKVRISQVCPFYFKVKVAVISKGGTVRIGGQRRP